MNKKEFYEWFNKFIRHINPIDSTNLVNYLSNYEAKINAYKIAIKQLEDGIINEKDDLLLIISKLKQRLKKLN